MSGDSPEPTAKDSSETTPTPSPTSSDSSVEILSPAASLLGPSKTLLQFQLEREHARDAAHAMRVPKRVAAETTGPRKGSLEAVEATLRARLEREKLREALSSYVNPWRGTISEVRKQLNEMLAAPTKYPRAQRMIARGTLAALRDKTIPGHVKLSQLNSLGRMLGAFGGESESDKVKRALEEARLREDSVTTEELIGGGKNGGAALGGETARAEDPAVR